MCQIWQSGWPCSVHNRLLVNLKRSKTINFCRILERSLKANGHSEEKVFQGPAQSCDQVPLRCSPAPPSHQYPSAHLPLKPTFLTLIIKFPYRLQNITEYFSFAVIMLKHWHIFFDFSHIADLLLLLSILFPSLPSPVSTLAAFRFPVTLTTGSWVERKQSMDLYISINQIFTYFLNWVEDKWETSDPEETAGSNYSSWCRWSLTSISLLICFTIFGQFSHSYFSQYSGSVKKTTAWKELKTFQQCCSPIDQLTKCE